MKALEAHPLCPQENIIQGASFRISILTESLLRLEYEESGHFTDNATQVVLNRNFPRVTYQIMEDTEKQLHFCTEALEVTYDKRAFSPRGLQIKLLHSDVTWNYGESGWNLLGTVRTLDETNGNIPYGKGLFSRQGYAFFEDGDSCELDGDEIKDRVHPETDLYFWGYGKEYLKALKAFYHLTGKTPMIPRYALGNWWSKYERYTEKSYLDVMEKFREEDIPIRVAVIDMDWHLTKVDPKYGSGWTGYTWNTEYFPDYKRFLRTLHEQGKAVTLNLHPADGIRAFECMYDKVARRMGIDPATEEPVEFDLMNPDFVDAYFEEVMQPYEADGVDFWWIDWQQGTKAKQGAVDPLWILNHYHYLDQLRRGKRAMIFSRFAGLGSHRYPIGFSGDTHATWESLECQPFFTATSSNVGYGWWSHDIGGHMHGNEDTERTTRWVQFGVFSPIMRLHSSLNPFFFKEPWNLPQPMRGIVGDFMRLREAMIPYLYTANYQAWKEDAPLIQPVYYRNPEVEDAYQVRNGYYFGEDLLVYAITEKQNPELQMASVQAYIPEGQWIDFFTGHVYTGEKTRKLYRSLASMPVLMKRGTILPMQTSHTKMVGELPEELDIYVAAGADGTYTLFEDDGKSNAYMQGAGVFTEFCQTYDEACGTLKLSIQPARGDVDLLPKKRKVTFHILGVGPMGDYPYDAKRHMLTIPMEELDVTVGAKHKLTGVEIVANDTKAELFELLKRSEIGYDLKESLYRELTDAISVKIDAQDLEGLVRRKNISENLKDAILELFS